MNRPSIAPRFLPVTAGALTAALLLLPQLQTAQAAKKPKPFTVKGTYNGTYLSQDGTITGPLKLVISSYKKLTPNAPTFLVKGKLSMGTKLKNQKCLGFYDPTARYIAVNTPTPRVYGGTFAGTLAGDDKTFNGTFAYTHVGAGDDDVIGTATAAKR